MKTNIIVKVQLIHVEELTVVLVFMMCVEKILITVSYQ